jgi:hypothetical protein
MKVLLTIGYNQILLPDDSGISTVMKVLAKGVLVHEKLYKGEIEMAYEGNPEQLDFKMQMVPDNTKFTLRGEPVELTRSGHPRPVREHPLNAGAKQLTTGQRQIGFI